MLKLPVRPYYSTYLESPCLNEKSHWFSYTWSAQTSVPPGWIMLCSLEVIYIWETKQPLSKNIGERTLDRLPVCTSRTKITRSRTAWILFSSYNTVLITLSKRSFTPWWKQGLLSPSCGHVLVLHPQICMIFDLFYSTRCHTSVFRKKVVW